MEDWREYTRKLRRQHSGEKAHMVADRARMEEVMDEERALWDEERYILKARIAELEGFLDKGKTWAVPPAINHNHRQKPQQRMVSSSSNAGSAESALGVPQESGRDADGSPFYAPAPRNPSRTFDVPEDSGMRIDSIIAASESAITVASKELTSSDFGVQVSPKSHPQDHLSTILGMPADTIDIQLIQPELEGVAIKASAVAPEFVAKVLSSRGSPQKLSPDGTVPPRNVTNLQRRVSGEDKKMRMLEIASQPENRRLTMHAGHTPNHSISSFSFLGGNGESGNATPTQEKHEEHLHRPSVSATSHASFIHQRDEHEEDEDGHGDKELSGPLGFTNDSSQDDEFLTQLVHKLEEARKSQDASPSNETETNMESEERAISTSSNLEDDEEEEKIEAPRLKLKQSTNFGRPFGSM